jgi:hypothetical protein
MSESFHINFNFPGFTVIQKILKDISDMKTCKTVSSIVAPPTQGDHDFYKPDFVLYMS